MQVLTLVHSVLATENKPELLATAIANQINGDAAFKKAGIIASPPVGATISITRPNTIKIGVVSALPSLTRYVQGPPDLLTITGIPQNGNSVTITATLTAQQPSTSGQSGTGAQTAPAAISGENPALK